jgi:AcrR family transcriptional regulator
MSSLRRKRIRKVARRDEQKAELREKIFAAGRELVLRKGFAELSIRKLAEEIGYAPGTIYLYFKNRDEIVREICVRGFAELYERIKSAGDVTDPQRRLAALLLAYADFAINNPETYRLSFMEDPKFTGEMFRSAPLEQEDGAGRQAFFAVVKAVRDLKTSRKLARSEDENLLAEVLWAGVHGVVSLKLIYPAFPTNSTELLVNKMIDTLLNGLN